MKRKTKAGISRRIFGKGLIGAAGVATAGSLASANTPEFMSLAGQVRWCNRSRGLLMFRPNRPDAGDMLIALELKSSAAGHEADTKLREALRPMSPVTIAFAWRPDVDILAPWQPREVVASAGERFAAAT
jgi:hypothetical protein